MRRGVECAALALAALCCIAAAPPPVPVAEDLDVATLPPPTPRRLYIWDVAWNHAKDGRVWVADGDTLATKGMIPAAFYANFLVDPKGRWDAVAETIWTRGNRGDRQDLLTLYDPATLSITAEIPLPGRALVSTKRPDAAVSADGRYIYVYDSEPAGSVKVVEPEAHRLAATIEVPGCTLVYAWGNRGFASLCYDGSLASVTFDEEMKPAITHTTPFNAPETDPVFEHSPTDRDRGVAWFISYAGQVYLAKLGPNPIVQKPWSIAAAAGLPTPGMDLQRKLWRPGGWQLAALHKGDDHLFVLMHQGAAWSHKDMGTEVWELDAGRGTLVRRIPLATPANSIAVTQEAKPLLYTLSETTGTLTAIDLATAKVLRQDKTLGDDGYLLMTVEGE